MGILSTLWDGGGKRGVIDHSTLGIDASMVSGNHSGVFVNEYMALTVSAIWACLRIISELLSSLPLHVYRSAGERRFPVPDHPVERVIFREPNPFMNSETWRKALTAQTALWGNGYAVLERDQRGGVGEIFPLLSDRVQIVWRGKSVLYDTYSEWYGQKTFRPDQILHLKGFTLDGVKGISTVGVHRQAIGLSKAAEECGARLFGQGMRAAGVIEHPRELTPDGAKLLRDSFQAAYGGLPNMNKPLVLEEGAKWVQLSLDPEDAQFLETRRFQISEIARMFRVPLVLLDEHEKAATYASVEQFMLSLVVHTLLPWICSWEQECKRKLFAPSEALTHYVKHNVDGLLRGDIKTRYLAYAIGRQWGWLSANDVLRKEDENPIEGGDTYLSPSNMVSADTIKDALDSEGKKHEGEKEVAAMRRVLNEWRQNDWRKAA